MKRRRALPMVLPIVGTLAGAQAADSFRQLKGREIIAKFKGHEFTDEVHFAEVFNPDGTLAVISMGVRSAGKWRVSGTDLCISHAEDKERCFSVWMSGRNVQLRQAGVDISEEGILQKSQQRQ
jgi:hypothetical protein